MSSDQVNYTEQLPTILDDLPSQQQQQRFEKQWEVSLVSVVKDLAQERDFWMNMKMKETGKVRELASDLQIMKLRLEDLQKNYKKLEGEKLTKEELVQELNQKIETLIEDRKQSEDSSFQQIAVTTKIMQNLTTDEGDDNGAELLVSTPQEEKGNQTDAVSIRGRKRGIATVAKLTGSNKKQKLVKTPLKKVYEEEEDEDDEQDTKQEIKSARRRRRRNVMDSQDKGYSYKYNLRRRN
eukprot:TRINITY_DN6131_c0_g1_i1.p1 TRINITY_DN6131_c0_g1~~TRINITY_DN6131_c0_g1_i1.p1  ORF type:complete len:238 (-),score=47.48 TRINITY_DN6131_c0_g1_i1:811-1524(-)